MASDADVKTRAVGVIRDYLGEVTAKAYADFYTKQEEAIVLDSVTELLEEYVGKSSAKEILTKFELIKTSAT